MFPFFGRRNALLICFSIVTFWICTSTAGIWFTSTANPFASEYILFNHLSPLQQIKFIEDLDRTRKVSDFVLQIMTELNPSHESDREGIDNVMQMVLSFAKLYAASRPKAGLDFEIQSDDFNFTKYRFKFSRYDILLRLTEERLMVPEAGAPSVMIRVAKHQVLTYLAGESDFKSYALYRRLSQTGDDLPSLAHQILKFSDGDLKWYLAQLAIDKDRPEFLCLLFIERVQQRTSDHDLEAALQKIQKVSGSRTTQTSLSRLIEPAVEKYIFRKDVPQGLQNLFAKSLAEYLETVQTAESYEILRTIQRSAFWRRQSPELKEIFKMAADGLELKRPEFAQPVGARLMMNCSLVLQTLESLLGKTSQ